jgi:hypothetical protein
VFSCINIRSYFITETEAKLLNEINSFHSDFFFGSDIFTCKDVVVCLSDVDILHKFLETSRGVFEKGLDSCPFLGFIQLNDSSSILPYINKDPVPSEANIKIDTKSNVSKDSSSQSETQSAKDSIRLLNEIFPDLFDESDKNDEESDFQSNGHSKTSDGQSENGLHDHSNESDDKEPSPTNLHLDSQASSNTDNTDRPRPKKCSELASLLADDDVIVCTRPVQKRKYVPRSLVGSIAPELIESMQMTEWDASYLKMICIYAGFEQLIAQMGKVVVNSSTGGAAKPSDDLCSLDALFSSSDNNKIEFVEHHIPHVTTNSTSTANQPEVARYPCTSNANNSIGYATQLNRIQPGYVAKTPAVAAATNFTTSSITNQIQQHLNSQNQLHQVQQSGTLNMSANRIAYKQQHPRAAAYASNQVRGQIQTVPLVQQEGFGQLYQTQHQQQQANAISSLNSNQLSNRQISSSNVNNVRSNPCIRPARAPTSNGNNRSLFDLNNSALAATLTARTVLPGTGNTTTNGLQSRNVPASSSNTNGGYDVNLLNQLCALFPNNLPALNTHDMVQQQHQLNSLTNPANSNLTTSVQNANSNDSSANWLNNFLNNNASFAGIGSNASTSTSSNSGRASTNINANQLLNDLLTRSNGLMSQQLQQAHSNQSQSSLQTQRNTNSNAFANQSLNTNLSLWNGLNTNQMLTQTLDQHPMNQQQSASSSSASSLRSMTDQSSGNSGHRIYRVEVGGCTLRAVNLFPDSSFLVVLVGEIAQRMLSGVPYLNLIKILENVFEFQLFDISKYVLTIFT